jgi:hypothetical protein
MDSKPKCYDGITQCSNERQYYTPIGCRLCKIQSNNELLVIICPFTRQLCEKGQKNPIACSRCNRYNKDIPLVLLHLQELELRLFKILQKNPNLSNGYYTERGCHKSGMKGDLHNDLSVWCNEFRGMIQEARNVIWEEELEDMK